MSDIARKSHKTPKETTVLERRLFENKKLYKSVNLKVFEELQARIFGGRGMPELSYEEIVHHIVSDKPIPNVISIPDITLSESLRTISKMQPRPKPWEVKKEESQELVPERRKLEETDFFAGQTTSDLEVGMSQSSADAVSEFCAREIEFDSAIKNELNDDKV